jgi:hypothetical protein
MRLSESSVRSAVTRVTDHGFTPDRLLLSPDMARDALNLDDIVIGPQDLIFADLPVVIVDGLPQPMVSGTGAKGARMSVAVE